MMLSIRAIEMASPRFDSLKCGESMGDKSLDLTKGCRMVFVELTT